MEEIEELSHTYLDISIEIPTQPYLLLEVRGIFQSTN